MFFIISIFVFVLGLIVGSFLNVCIHRLPREESIVLPGSHCPNCKKPLFWYDNIPLLSYLALKGKCRFCGIPIHPKYFAVEFVTGAFYVWIWFYFGFMPEALVAAIFFSMLMVATVVDLEHQIIPDEISLGGLGLGLAISPFLPSLFGETIWWRGLMESFIGALVGGASIYLTGVFGNLIFRKDSMGGGDVKLMAMMGAFMGWEKILIVYLLAPILALPLGLFLKFGKKIDVLPYGPFLSLGGWISFIWGTQLINWYLGPLTW